MDHDRLFKELLTTFFVEFVQLFLPNVAAYLDPNSLEFLDKEVFTDVTAGTKREVDLLVKARFQDHEAFFLIHVENQSKTEADFPKRMFTYFARLHEKYNLPVYPIVLFSHDAPPRLEPHRYQVAFPAKTVLQFEYVTIQLNRLSWRDYVSKPNPVASALMAKMKITPRDRPKVRLECLRLLATLKLDPARSQLIGGFIGTYLKLNAEEMKQYEQEFAKLTPEEKEANMELMNPWVKQGWEEGKQEGIQEGIQVGKEEIVVRQLNRRFGSVSAEVTARLNRLSSEHLNDLGEALIDFKTPADLEIWLSQHNPQ
jgi:hypothetical protein